MKEIEIPSHEEHQMHTFKTQQDIGAPPRGNLPSRGGFDIRFNGEIADATENNSRKRSSMQERIALRSKEAIHNETVYTRSLVQDSKDMQDIVTRVTYNRKQSCMEVKYI